MEVQAHGFEANHHPETKLSRVDEDCGYKSIRLPSAHTIYHALDHLGRRCTNLHIGFACDSRVIRRSGRE